MDAAYNWRDDLKIIGFVNPLNKLAGDFFKQVYNDPLIEVEVKPELSLTDGGLKLHVLVSRGEIKMPGIVAELKEQQINLTIQQHKVDLQKILISALGESTQTLYNGMNQIFYRQWMMDAIVKNEKLKEENQKVDENAATPDKVETPHQDGQSS